MKKYLFLILFILGCGGGGGSSNDNTYIDVFTIAPVKNLLITDNNGQIAQWDENQKRYYFKTKPTYPITATTTPDSYVDIDYDNIKSANDLKPLFNTLKSFNNQINYLTNYYYINNLQEYNISTNDFIYTLSIKYNINPNNSVLLDPNYQRVLFGVYNYIAQNGSIPNIDAPLQEVANVNNFINTYLNDIQEKEKYYAFYDSLLLLDKRLITRADTIHKPTIEYLRDPINIIAKNEDIDVFDIVIDDAVYTASGHEELGILTKNLEFITSSTPDTLSFARELYKQEYNQKKCLFVADSKNGVKVFDITNPTKLQTAHILYYIDDGGNKIPFTLSNALSVNGYVSTQQSKRLVGISTDDNGFYLLNGSIFNDCSLAGDITTSNFLIPPTGAPSISSAFRKDGTYLYVSQVSTIDGYDISILDQTNILASKFSFTPANNESVYKLLLINNDHQLIAGTNKGIQVYQIDNSNQLNFLNEYSTEGATDGYYQDMLILDNFLIFTDGYKGLKVLKYDDSFNPMLCGVEYFSVSSNSNEIAKVNSVAYENGYLYVGVDSLGIIKFPFTDILFQHCK